MTPDAVAPGLPRQRIFVATLPFVAYGIYLLSRGDLRWEQAALVIAMPALAWGNGTTRKLCLGVYPLALVGLFYDLMGHIQNLGVSPGTVHLCDLRAAELRFFGVTEGGVRMTLQDYFHAHASTALDLLCAIPYGTFIYVSIAFAVFLFVRDFSALQRFAWGFLLLNLAGFATYHVFPAAPPWYFRAHGCAVDITARASEGTHLAHVDELLGVPYFAGMYGRASDVFGAVPSLHVTYPLLICLEGYRLFNRPLRVASALFFASMCFAAVYLDHHWVIDVLAGIAYCLVVFALIRVAARSRRAPALGLLLSSPGDRPGWAESSEVHGP